MSDVRPCPVCGEAMQEQHHKVVKIDVCEAHGMWLDNGELDAITLSVTKRMGRRSKRRVGRAIQYGRHGWLATLFD